MLSDKLMKELLVRSSVKDEVIAAAWPSLCTETKLHLISELQAGGEHSLTDKVFEVAGNDREEIVRFWAARYGNAADIVYDARRIEERSEDGRSWHWEHSTEAIEVAKRLQADSSELVRNIALLRTNLFSGPEEPLNPQQRLLAARYFGNASIFGMMKWIDELWKDRLCEETDIALIIGEVLRSPRAKDEFQPEELSRDGMTHYHNVSGAKEIWEMAARLPKHAALEIGYYAPILVERTNVLEQIFDDLPGNSQAAAVSRHEKGVAEIAERVRSSPDKYEKEVVEQVERDDRYEFEMPTLHEIQKARIRRSVDREEAIVDLIIDLTEKIDALKDEVGLLSNSRTGGFWRR